MYLISSVLITIKNLINQPTNQNNMSVAPSNNLMYSACVPMTLRNWNPEMTQKLVTDLFEHNQTGRVSKFIVNPNKRTATVYVDRWYNTENGNAALYFITFTKFFDVCVEYPDRNMFLLFTLDDNVQKQMQIHSGPPGLTRRVTK